MGSISTNGFYSLPIFAIGFFILAVNSAPGDYCYGGSAPELELTINQGKLRGVRRQTHLGRNVSAFLGIPYVEPPIGSLRFAAPVPAAAWEGTFEANNDGPSCPQNIGGYSGDEDCLHLNVFTPKTPTKLDSKLLPTMVYIFGGGFQGGNDASVTFNQMYLLDEDVVLVVANYRMGALGFLSTGDEVVPGNNGLKDLVEVFKWVQENIAFFGGDPDSVTMFGHSSGSATVHFLALSPLMDGLFHRYITQSGSALASWSFTENSVYTQRAYELGSYVGCSATESSELIECLRKVSASDIVLANPKFYKIANYPFVTWSPTNEPDLEGAALNDTPQNMVAAGKIRDLPWISGVVKDEGLGYTTCYYVNETMRNYVIDNIDEVLPYMLIYHDRDIDQTAYTEALKAYYLNDMTIDRKLILANLTLLVQDGLAMYPAWVALQQQVAQATSPAYFYTYEHQGTFSYTYLYCGTDDILGVAHGDELVYLFDESTTLFAALNKSLTSSDMEMINILIPTWTSFATCGAPVLPDTCSVSWEPYDTSNNNLLRIGNGASTKLEVQNTFYAERMRFWDELGARFPGSANSEFVSKQC